MNNSESDTNSDSSYDSDSSLNSSLESFNLNENTIKKIKHNRNRPRINYGNHFGSLAFDVVWTDDTITREPIQNLIYKETEEVNEHILDILNDYRLTAQKYPSNNRMCIMCFNKVHNGFIMCTKHRQKYNFLNF
tara:strand:- start:40 stop:441 length:402 start_codon:yes stop_codon:yes gene_type:complete